MKSGKITVYLFLCLFLLISACTEEKEKEKGDYSGVSGLIADRNRARYEAAERPSQRKQVTQKKLTSRQVTPKRDAGQSNTPVQSPETEDQEISSIILYEQKINIVGSESGKTLAKGTAYINKQGQIVRIKIQRE